MVKIFFSSCLFLVLSFSTSFAQIEFEQIKSRHQEKLTVTAFADYYPIGKFTSETYSGALREFIDDFSTFGNYNTSFIPPRKGYAETIRSFGKGGGDVVLGIYNDTSLYNDLKYIYPAAFDNPIVIMMLPSRMSEVKSPADLKNMKGAVHSQEIFSGYVENDLKSYKIEYIDNSYDLYGKLINSEVDYIFTSPYFARIELAKLGLLSQVAMSKQAIWSQPIFIGISKASSHREFLSHHLSQILSKKETQNKIQKYLMNLVAEAEKENALVVPPTYSTKKM